jgi:hypothetical protein
MSYDLAPRPATTQRAAATLAANGFSGFAFGGARLARTSLRFSGRSRRLETRSARSLAWPERIP